LGTLAIDADSPNGDFRTIRNSMIRHNSHIERIQIESIVKEQIVNDIRDVQHEGETLPTVFGIL
jgi:hypothetical protein